MPNRKPVEEPAEELVCSRCGDSKTLGRHYFCNGEDHRWCYYCAGWYTLVARQTIWDSQKGEK